MPLSLLLPLMVLPGLTGFGCAPTTAPPAAPARMASQAPAAPAYADPKTYDYEAPLGGPPPDGSPEHRREVERMLSLQESRTPEEVRRCKEEENVTVFAFSTVLGPWFNAQDLPVTASVMGRVYDMAKAVSDPAKKKWKRVRPPLADPRIRPCVKLEESYCYPSGHAVRGVVWATLLAELFPGDREALAGRGRQIGDDRFLAGMHYPSDVAAGQKLGVEVARRMLADPGFQRELDRVRHECLAAQLRHASHTQAQPERKPRDRPSVPVLTAAGGLL